MPGLFEKLSGRLKKDKKSKRVSSSTNSIAAPASASTDNTPIASTSEIDRKDDGRAPSGRKKEFLECGVTALSFLKEISEASGLLAPLKAACGATKSILETMQAMDNNTEGWKGMLERIRRHHQTFEDQLGLVNAKMETATASEALLTPIKAYAKELEELLKELMRESGISEENVPAESKFQALKGLMLKYGTVQLEASRISDYGIRLDEAMKQFNTSMTINMNFKLHSVDQKLDFNNQKLDSELHTVNQKLDQLNAKLPPPEPIADTKILLKPRPSLAQNFVGREDILEKMRQTHITHRSSKSNTPAITVLSGLGGSGKTQIALKFALEVENLHPDVPVYFLNADSEASLQGDYENLIRSLGKEHHSKSHYDALTWLATMRKTWFIILDNADNPDLPLFSYIPKSTSGNVIITTRNANRATLATGNTHPVEGLSEADSVALVLNSSGYESTQANQVLATEIVRELGNLPLALAQAAGYIFVNKCLSRYLTIYRKSTIKVLSSFSSERPEDYRPPVARTIQMSLDRLPSETQDVLRLFAHLDPTQIPYSIIAKAAERQFEHVALTERSGLNPGTLEHAKALRAIFYKDGEWSDFDFNEIVTQCLQYSLLQIRTRGEDNFYSMHILVRSYLKASSTLIQGYQPYQLVIRLLGSSITFNDNQNFIAFNRLLLTHLRLIRLEDVTEAGDHLGFGQALYETGDWKLALAYRERCVETWRTSLGDEHANILRAMMDLALSYRHLGRSQDALELDEQVLASRRKLLGPEHPDTLKAIHYLAVSYRGVGRKEEAMGMEEQVLEMRKKVLGPESPDTLATMNNLANSYTAQGRIEDAMKLEEQVLELRKKVSGPENPETLTTMSNLAVSYRTVGRFQEAMELKEQVLELRKKVLGPEHPDTLVSMSNLAFSYHNLGRLEGAMELKEQVLELRKKVLGPEHPETLISMGNLATSYSKLGRLGEAMGLQEQAVELRKKVLGPEHPDTLASMHNLALSYSKLGRFEEAIGLEEQVVELRTKVLGLGHLDTAWAMWNLYRYLRDTGLKERNLDLLPTAVPVFEKVWGLDGTKTMKAKRRLKELELEMQGVGPSS